MRRRSSLIEEMAAGPTLTLRQFIGGWLITVGLVVAAAILLGGCASDQERQCVRRGQLCVWNDGLQQCQKLVVEPGPSGRCRPPEFSKPD